MKRPQTFFECGCCGSFHRTDWYGDCREDKERYADIPKGGREVEAKPVPLHTLKPWRGASPGPFNGNPHRLGFGV